ncbi:23S rRNA pseudouridine1911/1915/1917 synthase [Lachnospiraceae bacterium RM5]|nr:23S rRNA pseudouridine1911/1915/1917 synthase [Lachnospiraceae bacterium RM5]
MDNTKDYDLNDNDILNTEASDEISDKKKYIVDIENAGIRIDKFIAGNLSDLSRTHIQNLITDQYVLVNNNPVKSNYKLSEKDVITMVIPQLKEPDIVPEDIPLDILYEDNDIIVVNKGKGMVVHPARGHYSGTLVNALLFHCKDNLSGINGITRPGIVHRIDMDTTGAIVVCKNDFAHNNLALQLKEHTINRKYIAIVHGNLKDDEGRIESKIGRALNNRLKMQSGVVNGKEAITNYRVLERFGMYTYIECILETGRTHQIRVHMSSIGHPLLGDKLYGPEKCPYNLTGQTLHARILGFNHPVTNEYMEFEAPIPEYFSHLLEILRNKYSK